MGIVTIQSGGLQEQFFPVVPYIPLVFGGSYRHLPYCGTRSSSFTIRQIEANYLFYIPFILGRRLRVTKLGFVVTDTAGTRGRCGVYSNGTNNRPSSLIAQTGDLTTGTQGLREATMNFWLDEGILYWAAICCDGTPTLNVLSPLISPALVWIISGPFIWTELQFYQMLAGGWTELPANAAGFLQTSGAASICIFFDFSLT